MKRRLFKAVGLGLSLLFLGMYLSMYIPPGTAKVVVYLNYFIAPTFLLNTLISLLLLAKKNVKHALNVSFLLGALLVLPQSISLHPFDSGKADFSLMNYNVRGFYADENRRVSKTLLDWIADEPYDIKCFQEYRIFKKYDSLDIEKILVQKGYTHRQFANPPVKKRHNAGLAIFSKHPIVSSGEVFKVTPSFNGTIYADIAIDTDTVRVYNVHLESMRLMPNHFRQNIRKLKSGATERQAQIALILEHIASCPYPYVLAGDFNEMPYNYNYVTLRDHFKNTFEKAGFGFGFSFRPIPWLRIDHQFYSTGLKARRYRVAREMTVSDHFAVQADYSFKK